MRSPISIPSGVTITLQPSSGVGQLTAFSNVANAGNLNLIASASTIASLAMSGYTLTNTGTLTTSVTTTPSSPADVIYATLNNSTGTVNINASTEINGSITNGGTFNIASGQTLSFGSSTDSFTQNGGTLTITGVLNMPNNNFIDSGGTITGTVNMGGNSNTPTLTLGSGAGNSGTFVFSGEGGALIPGGAPPISIPSGVAITLQPTSGVGQLTAFSNVTNAGNLNLIASASTIASLAMSGYTLTNTGTLTTSVTTTPSSPADVIYATLNNSTGTVNINASTEINGSITNGGTFNIASGQTLSFGNGSDISSRRVVVRSMCRRRTFWTFS